MCNALGVAVVGSLLVSGYHSVLTTRTRKLHLSQSQLAASRTSLGTALGIAHHIGGDTGRALADAARAAYVHGMRIGALTCAAALVIGAVLALRYLPARAHETHEIDGATAVAQVEVFVE